jgi:2-dehydro-3-deoxygluconokinase
MPKEPAAMTQTPRFELTSLGETMLRLSVPAGQRLEKSRALDMHYGGAESNVCIALARLGRRCGWVSRLPTHALGDGVERSLRAEGVDTSAVVRSANERLGIYFVEYAEPPRAIQVIYDRAHSAASTMAVDTVAWEYLLSTRVLHLTGITAALSESCYNVVATAIERARDAGVLVSFDVNFRSRLWDAATAAERLRPLMANVDILFCKGADAAELFGCRGSPQEQVERLAVLTTAGAIYATFGAAGAALLHEGRFLHLPALPVRIIDRLGSGDAFAAGALDGVLDGDPAAGLQRGLVLAALALSQQGDSLLTSRAEMESLLGAPGTAGSGGADIQR